MQAERTMSQSTSFDPSSSSDEELLKYINRGNSFAFNCLYERYGQRLYAYALRLTENPALAEDILQESMLIVWRKAGTYRAEGSVLAWLLSIIRNKCMQLFRQKPTESIESSEVDIPDENSSLEKNIAQQDERDRVRAALRHLSPEHREVLELVFYQGLSQKEIAQVCRCPVGTVKSRLAYARQQLRGILTRDGFETKDEP